MTMNLFSSFDPSTNILSMNWISLFLLLFSTKNYWMKTNLLSSVISKMLNYLFKEMSLLTNKKILIVNLSIFMLILSSNFLSLTPQFFCWTSHMSTNMSMILPVWVGLMMYSWINKFNFSMIHLVPNLTPLALSPLIIIIELVVNIMRPFTLSVRLMANMMSGHLMLNLMSNIMFLSYQLEFIYLLLEISISFLQAYIFILMINLFISEIN